MVGDNEERIKKRKIKRRCGLGKEKVGEKRRRKSARREKGNM
jgi:hypothetical protein